MYKLSDCFKKFGKKTEGEKCNKPKCGCGGAVYGIGLIGAAVYFIGEATSFWFGVLGFLKALAWPAFLVYQLFEFLAK
ncbi:MAG: hypothetical protein WC565_00205 [Parcubacteria group bacterium]